MNNKNRDDKIKKMVSKGLSYGAVAELFKISRARVHQIYSGYKSPSGQTDKMKKLYQIIMLRDELTCQWGDLCKGKFVAQKNLVVHHINFNNKDNRRENLITLCRKCHLFFHCNNHIDDKRNPNRPKTFRNNKKKNIRLKKVLDLKAKGLSLRQIGKVVGLSQESIRTLLNKYKIKEAK